MDNGRYRVTLVNTRTGEENEVARGDDSDAVLMMYFKNKRIHCDRIRVSSKRMTTSVIMYRQYVLLRYTGQLANGRKRRSI